MKIKVSNVNTPNWKDVNVKSHIPAELEKLSELAHNIWWAWNYEATELFRDLDPALWKEVGQNPVLLLERMSYANSRHSQMTKLFCAEWMTYTPSSAHTWM